MEEPLMVEKISVNQKVNSWSNLCVQYILLLYLFSLSLLHGNLWPLIWIIPMYEAGTNTMCANVSFSTTLDTFSPSRNLF